MFSWVKHEKSFITSGPGFGTHLMNLFFRCWSEARNYSYQFYLSYQGDLTGLCLFRYAMLLGGFLSVSSAIKNNCRNVKKRTFGHVRPAKIHSRSLFRIFSGRILDSQGCKVSSCAQRRLWSDYAHGHANMSLRWTHKLQGDFSQAYVLWRLRGRHAVPRVRTVPFWTLQTLKNELLMQKCYHAYSLRLVLHSDWYFPIWA